MPDRQNREFQKKSAIPEKLQWRMIENEILPQFGQLGKNNFKELERKQQKE
jgi:hypothetical protein